jgi:hypothetical protein
VWSRAPRGVSSSGAATRRTAARGIRAGKRVLAGPFLGEVGFELLYWIPVLRRILAGVDRERVTILTRGGAGRLVPRLRRRRDRHPRPRPARGLPERARRAPAPRGEHEAVLPGRARQAADSARARADRRAVVIHPLVMYSRMRFVLELLQPVEAVTRIGEYRELLLEDRRPAAGLPRRLRRGQALLQRLLPGRRSVPCACRARPRRARGADGRGRIDERAAAGRAPGVGTGGRAHPRLVLLGDAPGQSRRADRSRRRCPGARRHLRRVLLPRPDARRAHARALWTQDVFQRVHLDVLPRRLSGRGYELVGPS